MASKYSDEELKALSEKSRNPDNVVLCPRCGKELLFTDYGCGYEIKCMTNGCIKRSVRGL